MVIYQPSRDESNVKFEFNIYSSWIVCEIRMHILIESDNLVYASSQESRPELVRNNLELLWLLINEQDFEDTQYNLIYLVTG